MLPTWVQECRSPLAGDKNRSGAASRAAGAGLRHKASTRRSRKRLRYKYAPGELVPSGELQIVVSHLPAGKDHAAKAFAFDDEGRMLVEIGSPYNVYSDGDRRFGAKGKSAEEVAEFQKTYGGFWRFDPAKLDQRQSDGVRFSTGHRHSLALA